MWRCAGERVWRCAGERVRGKEVRNSLGDIRKVVPLSPQLLEVVLKREVKVCTWIRRPLRRTRAGGRLEEEEQNGNKVILAGYWSLPPDPKRTSGRFTFPSLRSIFFLRCTATHSSFSLPPSPAPSCLRLSPPPPRCLDPSPSTSPPPHPPSCFPGTDVDRNRCWKKGRRERWRKRGRDGGRKGGKWEGEIEGEREEEGRREESKRKRGNGLCRSATTQ